MGELGLGVVIVIRPTRFSGWELGRPFTPAWPNNGRFQCQSVFVRSYIIAGETV